MNKKILITILSFLICNISLGQDKEILIIGTMHTVPKIIKNSYRPLLKRAIKYSPEAIYVESPMPDDYKSWEYLKNGWAKSYQRFYNYSDSLKTNYQFDQRFLDELLLKNFSELSEKELDVIIKSFGYLRDNANSKFYQYLKKYGAKGSKKPMRHEDGDLTAKLALATNIKKLKSMDDQQTNREYHEAWKKCLLDGRTNGDNRINKKLSKKEYNRAIIPALFGRLGIYANKKSSLENLHTMSSFTYVKNKTENCSAGEKYWNERNERMAKNIGEQILRDYENKNIVLVGASHVIGLEKELKKQFPEIKIKLINE